MEGNEKRRHKRDEAFKILAGLSNATDRQSILRAFALKLDDRDKLRDIANLYDSDRITKGELWDLLLTVYHAVNDPRQHYDDVLRLFRDAFSAKGLVRFENDPIPTDPIRLYRAAFPGSARGISWSWDRASAEKFLTAPGKRLYTVLASPKHFLGVFSKIGEREVMLDYDLIDEPEEAQ